MTGNDISDHRCWTGSSELMLASLPSESVDLAVTRLPEPGVADYVRSQRLTCLWFGWNIEDYESKEIGARYRRRRRYALADYLDEMGEIFEEVARLIKSRRWCALILGSTICKDGLADELSRVLALRGLVIVSRLGGRTMGSRRTTDHQYPREEIIVAWKEN
jgi:hypothetical protein